jgi:ribose/xylose/arabinose/galactoside ABC-type transport system permease subunit
LNKSRLSASTFWQKFRLKPEYMGTLLIVAITILNIVMVGPGGFFSSSSMQNIFMPALPLVILTMGQVIVLVSGNIDLSSGIAMSFVNVFAVMMPVKMPWMPVWSAYIIAFLLVVFIGYLNGFLVGVFRIPPMLATYGMSFIIKGINLIISDRPQGHVDRDFWKLYQGDVFGIPNSVFLLIILILVWFYLKKRADIKEIYALGGDEKATYLTGISTVKTTIRAFTLNGVFVGLAGIVWTLMLASSNPINGDIKTLQSIAAALIGGVLITGGWGTMICGILGALFWTLVNNATSYMFTKFIPSLIPGFSVSTYYQDFTSQVIIMLGIILAIVASNRTKQAVKNIFRMDNKESETR